MRPGFRHNFLPSLAMPSYSIILIADKLLGVKGLLLLNSFAGSMKGSVQSAIPDLSDYLDYTTKLRLTDE